MAGELGYRSSWGSYGDGPGQLGHTNGVAIGGTGDVVVLDKTTGRVQRFSESGQLLAGWQAHIPIVAPQDVAVAGNGEVYVSRTGSVQVFDRDGALLRTIGTDAGWVPIAVDAAGRRLFITSGSGLDIYDAQTGATLGRIEMRDLAPWGLIGPLDVAIGPDGDVYVLTVTGNRARVWRFATDSALVGSFAVPDFGYSGTQVGLAVGEDGDVFVLTGSQPDLLQRFSGDGTLQQEIRRCNAPPSGGAHSIAASGNRLYTTVGPKVDVYGPGGSLTSETTCTPPAGPPAPPVGPPQSGVPNPPIAPAPASRRPDLRAPVKRAVVTIDATRATVTRRGAFRVAVQCRARERCSATLTVSTVARSDRGRSGKAQRLTLARLRTALPSDARRTVRLQLNQQGRQLLARSSTKSLRTTLDIAVDRGLPRRAILTLSRAKK